MLFYSTNHNSPDSTLTAAVMRGLAPDGGLYMPRTIPEIPRAFFNNIADMSIRDISYVVANILLANDIPSRDLRNIVNDTFTFDIPLVKVTGDIYSLELFHGPTLAFKDVGARFLARLLAYMSAHNGLPDNITVLVATSGDSGGAVARGFHNVPGVKVCVLYPSRTLSEMQERQFTTLGDNVYSIEVAGTFDDCQALVKQAFMDRELRERISLTSANSINIGRLLPQMFYYFHAYSRLLHQSDTVTSPEVVISVPCGNLGNLTAALMAKRMGLPIKRFITANNLNDTFARFLTNGEFKPAKSVRTIANAMDVGNPSNIRRIMDMYGDDIGRLRNDVSGCSFTDDQIADTMLEVYRAHNYILEPHGATAYRALIQQLGENEKGIFLETAHPSKFARRVNRVLGVNFKNPADKLPPIKGDNHLKIAPAFSALKNYLLSSTH
ncbi:MAG: threonine synthase [Lachnoclostridium sp.]|nr:threonine synthase [Lachnoclostridium sp.]